MDGPEGLGLMREGGQKPLRIVLSYTLGGPKTITIGGGFKYLLCSSLIWGNDPF